MNIEQIRAQAQTGATHYNGKVFIRNPRERKENEMGFLDGYTYAYEFFVDNTWQGCICDSKGFFNLKRLFL